MNHKVEVHLYHLTGKSFVSFHAEDVYDLFLS